MFAHRGWVGRYATPEDFNLAIKYVYLPNRVLMICENARRRAPLGRAVTLLLIALALVAPFATPVVPPRAPPPSHQRTSRRQHKSKLLYKQPRLSIGTPRNARPSLESLAQSGDFGDTTACQGRNADANQSSLKLGSCTFGMKHASRTMVLTGDSRAGMWFSTVNAIAKAAGYKLIFLAKYGCPSAFGVYKTMNNSGLVSNTPWTACSQWHTWVTKTISSLHPRLILVSSSDQLDLTSGGPAPASAIETGFEELFRSLPKASKLAVLGGFPIAASSSPTLCLSKSPSDPSKCAAPKDPMAGSWNAALQSATEAVAATYIDQSDWLCARTCPGIIAGIVVYTSDGYHIDATYARYLTGALWTALQPDLS